MARRCRSELEPRGLTEADCARYLGRSVTWFQQHRDELRERGFPERLPLLDLYDRRAVDRWMDELGDPNCAARDWSGAWHRAAGNA
jgi:hypothetical protein